MKINSIKRKTVLIIMLCLVLPVLSFTVITLGAMLDTSMSYTSNAGQSAGVRSAELPVYIVDDPDDFIWTAVGVNRRIEGLANRVRYMQGVNLALDIPNIIDAGSVTTIAVNAFNGYIGNTQGNIISVVLPDVMATATGATTAAIGASAFRGNIIEEAILPQNIPILLANVFRDNNLTEIEFPNTLTNIGADAFRDNLLKSIVIPDGVMIIGANAFNNNNLSGNLIVPDSVITMTGAGIFANNSLTSVELSKYLTSLGTDAFNNAFDHSLTTSLTVPSNIQTIGTRVFQNNNLNFITIESGVTAIGANTFENLSTIIPNPSGSIVVIPDTVASIGNSAFRNSGITEITFGNGLTALGNDTFRDNRMIDLVLPASLMTVGNSAFNNAFDDYDPTTSVIIQSDITLTGTSVANRSIFQNNNLNKVTVKSEVTNISQDLFRLAGIKELVFEGTDLLTIGVNAFRYNMLTTLDLPLNLQDIGNDAFRNAFDHTKTASASIPGSVTNFGIRVFMDNELNNVMLGGGITVIPTETFRNNQIASIAIPDSVIEIQNDAFRNAGLTDVTFGIASGLTSILANGFRDNLLVTLELPQSLMTMGNEVFRNAFDYSQTTSVTIQSDIILTGTTVAQRSVFADNYLNIAKIRPWVTDITNDLFRNAGLIEVVFEGDAASELLTIGNNAFRTNRLQSLDLPQNLDSIGSNAFQGNRFETVHIPDSVTVIGRASFMDGYLTSFTIGSGLRLIPDETFRNNRFVDLYVSGTDLTIGESGTGWGPFSHNQYLRNVIIGSGVATIEERAFDGRWQGNQNPTQAPPYGQNFGIETVRISADVIYIGQHAFNDNNIRIVTVDPHPQGLSLLDIAEGAFQNNSLRYIGLSNSVRSIGRRAFASNFSLETVTMPNTITTIGPEAFLRTWSGFTTHTVAQIFVEDGADTSGWASNAIPHQYFNTGDTWNVVVWGVVRTPQITVTHSGGASSTDFAGATGSGTENLQFELYWAGSARITLHSGIITDIIINGQSIAGADTTGILNNNSAVWERGALGGHTVVLDLSLVGHNLNIVVVSQPFTITYNDLHDTTHTNPEIFIISTPVITLSNPTTNRNGYVFAGWWTTSQGAGTRIIQITPGTGEGQISENQVFYARWDRIYTIEFRNVLASEHDNDAEFWAGVLPYTLLVAGDRLSHTFGGWWTHDGTISGNWGTQITSIAAGTTGNQIVYARWNIRTYTVTFTVNGIVRETINNVNRDTLVNSLIPPIVLVAWLPEGHEFVEWRIGGVAINGQTITEATNIVALTRLRTYTVTFTVNGAVRETINNVDWGTLVNSLNAPAILAAWLPEGHEFVEWRIGGVAANGQTITEATDIEAFTRLRTYSIIFNTHGGTPVETITANFGVSLSEPPNPAKTGYIFRHWSLIEDGIAAVFPSTMPAGGLTLHAVWKAETSTQYNITFNNLHNGVHKNAAVANAGTQINLTKATREGYTFIGWFDAYGNEVTTFVINRDIDLYAKWEVISHGTIISWWWWVLGGLAIGAGLWLIVWFTVIKKRFVKARN